MYHRITEYVTAYLWERGGRERNEDALAVVDVNTANKHVLLAAVADGVGGLSHGDKAASYIISELRRSFIRYTQDTISPNSDIIKHIFYKTLYSCHRHIREQVFITQQIPAGSDEIQRSASTVSLLCLIGSKGFYIHSGDSRLYLIESRPKPRGIKIRTIGKDHTDHRGRLIHCIGTGLYHKPSADHIRVRKGQTLLLCTDGFYKKAEKQSLYALSEQRCEDRLTDVLRKISDKNIRSGERDNQSAIAIKPQ